MQVGIEQEQSCGSCVSTDSGLTQHALNNISVAIPENMMLAVPRRHHQAGDSRMSRFGAQEAPATQRLASRLKALAASDITEADLGAVVESVRAADFGPDDLPELLGKDLISEVLARGQGDVARGLSIVACAVCQRANLLSEGETNG